MVSPAGLVERLTAAWNTTWPGTPPIAFLLRVNHPDRWVRFHSLPESKRYAETDDERATVLFRHHAVLDALEPSAECFAITTRFASDREQGLTVPNEPHFQTIEHSDYFDEPARLCAGSIVYPSGEFDNVLEAAADWELANVIIGPDDLRWLYHPYDGGADVIAASPDQRDQLKAEFSAWLSSHPDGL
jgi:hypothetical protein